MSTSLADRVRQALAFPEMSKCENMFLEGGFRARGMFKRLYEHYCNRKALDAALCDAVEALELAQGQCGIPDAGDACRAILRTAREALTRVDRALEGK